MYKLIGSVKSRAFRVLWLLEELGVPYQHLNVGPHSEEVLRYNPSGTLERAKQDALLHQILDEIDAVLWAACRRSLGLSYLKDAEVIRKAFEREYKNNIVRIMKKIKGPYLMGGRITIPDLVLTHCGGWAFVAKFPTDDADFKEYLKSMRGRPTYKKATEAAQH